MLRQVNKSIVKWPKAIFLCLLSGILLSLPFSNGRLWLFSWFGFLPLFIALGTKSKLRAFLFFYLAGMVFWALTIYWLIHVTLIGTIVLILYLALYFGLFGFTIPYLLPTKYCLFSIPSLWVILEYIRSCLFTGFPWALLGYSQYLNLPVIQISDVTGAWGVSFLVMMVNIIIYTVVCNPPRAARKNRELLLPAVCFFCVLLYGYYSLYMRPACLPDRLDTCGMRPIKVSVIQGNIPQELKWDPLSRSYIVNKYLGISRQAAKDKPDLIIWPEAALPVVLEEEPAFFAPVEDLARDIKIPLLLGAVTTREDLYYNSALLVSGKGVVSGRYDKLHLVPFGEYIPLRKILGFIDTIAPIGDIEKGRDYTVFTQPSKFSVLICFEDLFPELSRKFIKRGAGFLVNITNDAWYKQTPAPFQHFQASVFRAVENRVYVVRSANTGVSGFISPEGKAVSLVRDASGRNTFIDGFATREITVSGRHLSLYTRYGDVFPAICFLFVIYGIILKIVTSNS